MSPKWSGVASDCGWPWAGCSAISAPAGPAGVAGWSASNDDCRSPSTSPASRRSWPDCAPTGIGRGCSADCARLRFVACYSPSSDFRWPAPSARWTRLAAADRHGAPAARSARVGGGAGRRADAGTRQRRLSRRLHPRDAPLPAPVIVGRGASGSRRNGPAAAPWGGAPRPRRWRGDACAASAPLSGGMSGSGPGQPIGDVEAGGRHLVEGAAIGTDAAAEPTRERARACRPAPQDAHNRSSGRLLLARRTAEATAHADVRALCVGTPRTTNGKQCARRVSRRQEVDD